ncbi:MAG: hypothetical protein K0S27_1655 [Gammaproteobacteria bacterium]|nr:hypothetical protein [Gammaproteobacteria bacterium]
MNALLPPASAVQPLSPLKADPKQPSSVAHKPQQVPAAAASKASEPPQKEKGLFAKLGFNKNKSVPQQQAPAGNGAGATPVVIQQNNGLR